MLGRVAGLRERSRDLLLQLCLILQQDTAPPPGGSPGCLCAVGLRAPAPAEPPELGLQHPSGLPWREKRSGRRGEERFLGCT